VSTWSKLAAAGASTLVVVVALGGHFEGRKLQAYRDVGGTPTICDGETYNVKMGQVATPQECDAMIKSHMAIVRARVDACIDRPMTVG
jgi:lysozyme